MKPTAYFMLIAILAYFMGAGTMYTSISLSYNCVKAQTNGQ